MLSLPADTGRPVKKADPPAKKPEARKETSKKPSKLKADGYIQKLVGTPHRLEPGKNWSPVRSMTHNSACCASYRRYRL